MPHSDQKKLSGRDYLRIFAVLKILYLKGGNKN